MSKEWLKVGIAGGFEIGWVVGLNHASNWWQWGLTLLAIYISFYYLIQAGEHLPAGTAYAVFVGIGAVGTITLEILWFGGTFTWLKAVLITTLLIGIFGLKHVSGEEVA